MPASFQAPKLASRLAGQYNFSYSPASWVVALKLDRSNLEGANISAGTVAHVEMRNGVPRYDANGHIAGLDLHRLARPLRVAALGQSRFKSRITGNFHVEGRGRSLKDTVLKADASLTDS